MKHSKNVCRRSSLSTDTNSENPRERSKSLIEQSKHHHLKSSCPRTNLPELKSPGLLLNKNSRSRSEEPPELSSSSPVFSCNRPRHRSECSSHRSHNHHLKIYLNLILSISGVFLLFGSFCLLTLLFQYLGEMSFQR